MEERKNIFDSEIRTETERLINVMNQSLNNIINYLILGRLELEIENEYKNEDNVKMN